MAVAWYEGFDLYNGTGANTGIGTRWVAANGGFTFNASMVTGRFGGQALRVALNVTNYSQFRTVLPAVYSSLTLGFALRLSDLGNSAVVAWLVIAGNVQIALRVTEVGKIAIMSGNGTNFGGAATLDTSATAPIFANTWHFVEISTVIGTTGSVVVRVDGDTILTIASANTKPQASAGVDQLWFGSTNSTRNTDFDDAYVLNSTTPIGECRVETLRANGDTATAAWTPNSGVTGYTQVDDTLADGDTTYIQSTNVGDQSLFDMSDLSTTPTAIFAVQPVVFAEKTDSATRQLYATLKSAATDVDGTAVFLAASYNAYRPDIYETDPADAAAWTKTKVDALKVGPKVAA